MVRSNEKSFKAQEFAQLAGVTVRTLHHYDRIGLLKPGGRTEAGYRLYRERDLARLEQITVLKFLGLSLRQIRDMLRIETRDLGPALQLQLWALLEETPAVGQHNRSGTRCDAGSTARLEDGLGGNQKNTQGDRNAKQYGLDDEIL